MEQGVIMEITRDNIRDTIQKMVLAGKQMPQKDRIRLARDPAAEQLEVLKQTVDLWWDLFKDRHIGVNQWEQATQKALMVSGVTKLDVATINPALMSYAVEMVEKEHLANMQAEAQREKQEALKFSDAVTRIDVPSLWKLHARIHFKPYLPLPDYEGIRAVLPANYSDEYIKKNLLALQIYYLFAGHAKRDNTKSPLKLKLEDDGYLHIAVVA